METIEAQDSSCIVQSESNSTIHDETVPTYEDHSEASKQRSTSILELMYLIRAMNRGEMSFAEGFECMSEWAREVIAEHENGAD